MKTVFIATPLILALSLTLGRAAETAHPAGAPHTAGAPAHGKHWSYEGATGPEHWAELDPDCDCGKGKAQSPVDLTQASVKAGKSLQLDYGTTSLKVSHHGHATGVLDNGHTIQVSVDVGSTISIGGRTYGLKQFHFHTPSEHTVDGKHLPMELHFVHQSSDGKLAVLGVLFVEGASNPNLAKLIANFPAGPGQTTHPSAEKLDISIHLPVDRTVYSYAGSLTTPPCSEGVSWMVFREPVAASREQLSAFSTRLRKNNRPVQPLNGRVVETVSIVSQEEK
jgi:carbonic anhydrase